MAEVTVLDGNRFYVADSCGNAAAGSEGLYADDVRVLCLWRLTVDGRPTRVLGAGEEAGPFTAVVYGQVVEPGSLSAAPVTTRRWIGVTRAGMHESLRLTNHGAAAVEVVVRYEFATDFADLYEVKDRELGQPSLLVLSHLPPLSSSQTWLPSALAYRLAGWTNSFCSAVQISFSERGLHGEGETFFKVRLEPRAEWTLEANVLLLGADVEAPHPDPRAELSAGLGVARARLRDWHAGLPTLRSSWLELGSAYQCSVADLGALRTPVPLAGHRDGALLPAAGLPWFMAIFGRDTLITCLQTLALGQDLARAALRALAEMQSTVDDPARDAEPGKILHEVRYGKVAKLTGRLPYYGSVDSTPLFLLLAIETWRWTGDADLMRELEPHLRAALGWIEGPANISGRGYVEFHRRAAGGIEVQSWKDSFNSMLFADGSKAESPIAPCEVQGYAYAARLGLAEIADDLWGDAALAQRLRRDAAELAERFDRDFWVDTPAGGHYALALDHAGRRVDSLTSNIGHLLWTGIAAPSRVDRTVQALLGRELFSGWGVRTMSTADAGYNPVEYHNGTVWPHDTSLASLGLARVGRYAEAATLLRGLVEAASYVEWRLPEVLAGYDRADTNFPVSYPTTCSPQAWAAAAPIAALTAVLGLAPDPAAGTLTARGAPPPQLELTLRGVPALGKRWDVTAHAGTVTVRASRA
jgi:glycogen debranching enzyme